MSEFSEFIEKIDFAKWLPYLVCIAVLFKCIVFLTLDCDIWLAICRWIGRRPTSLKGKVVWIIGASGELNTNVVHKFVC